MKHKTQKPFRLYVTHWYITRTIFLIAGIFVFVSALLSLFVHGAWMYFTMFVGFMLVSFALSGYCPMAFFLDKIGMRRE